MINERYVLDASVAAKWFRCPISRYFSKGWMRDAISQHQTVNDSQLGLAHKKTARHKFRERFFDGDMRYLKIPISTRCKFLNGAMQQGWARHG